jgi:hypothetical protein
MGSSSAGVILLYFQEKIYYLPLRFRRDHTIICTLNHRSMPILKDLVLRKQKPVVIEKDGNNRYIETCRQMGVIVLVGEPTDSSVLIRAGIQKAQYILCLDDSDEMNAEVALQAEDLAVNTAHGRITAIIQVLDPRLYLMMRRQAFASEGSKIHLDFFNQYAIGAKILLGRYAPLCRPGPAPVPYPVVIFGAGNLGEHVLTGIARAWYGKTFPGGARPVIILVDREAEKIAGDLTRRYTGITRACEIIPISLDVHSAAFENGTFLDNPVLQDGFSAYICFNNDTVGLCTSLILHRFSAGRNVRIIVRVEHNPHVAELVSAAENLPHGARTLIPVDMFSLTADSTRILAGEKECIARAIHENYCGKEREKGITSDTNRLLVSWEELGTLTQKKDGIDGRQYQESNRGQAQMIWSKLNLIHCDLGPLTDWDAPGTFRFSPEEIETLSVIEHERWMQDRLKNGWRSGATRDDRKKTHPSIIPYEQLSESEKEKDRDTVRQIPFILSLADFQIYRR